MYVLSIRDIIGVVCWSSVFIMLFVQVMQRSNEYGRATFCAKFDLLCYSFFCYFIDVFFFFSIIKANAPLITKEIDAVPDN